MKSFIHISIVAFSLYSSGSSCVLVAFGFSPQHSSTILRRPQQFHHNNDVHTSSSSSSLPLSSTTTSSTQQTVNTNSDNNSISKTVPSGITWEVFVSLANQSNKDNNNNNNKGVLSVASVMESFTSFSPSPGVIRVHTAIFHKQPNNNKVLGKGGGRGHLVRCIQKKDELTLSAIEVNNVDSVEKVYRIVTEHMRFTTVPPTACDCIKCYFHGNDSLEEGDTSKAIEMYNEALSLADNKRTTRQQQQQQQTSQIPRGTILMKRSRAYLQRATNHRQVLKSLVKELVDIVPSTSTIKILYQATTLVHPELCASIFANLAGDNTQQTKSTFRQIRYRHDMFEFALLHATQDSLQATKVLPQSANACYIAGECLAELRKLNESNQYYVRALALDPSMKDLLTGLMEKNKLCQELRDVAWASGFTGDTLRLALDVAAP